MPQTKEESIMKALWGVPISLKLMLAWIPMICVLAGEAGAQAPAKSDEPLVKVYGFVKPTVFVGTNLESYEQPNTAAVTAALNPVFANPQGVNRFYTFQAGQSRFGIVSNKIPMVTAKLELDFFDATKADPTVAS